MGYGATPSSARSDVCPGWCGLLETGVVVQHDHTAGMLADYDGGAKVSVGSALTLCISGDVKVLEHQCQWCLN
jgi:hypothetical protein